jgi:hypothetical protein
MTRTRTRGARMALAAGLLAVVAVMVGPPWAFMRWRETRLVALAAPEVQADWDAFRERMRRESGRDGPVQRKVRKSAEPPERVWLRDYWRLAIAAWVVFVGLGAAFIALLARGAAASTAEHGPRRGRDDEKQHQRDAQNADEGKHARTPAKESPGAPRGAP